VGDELVPYFNPSSQLLEQAQGQFNELTNGYEFRVRYSFLTTWLRHYMVLPFAILLVLPAIVSTAYLTTAWFMRRSFPSLPATTVYLATAAPTALIYMIMIYAKVTHFYTLVLGLCLMTVSAFLMLDALLFRKARWGRRMIAACLVTLFNPAVHYLVLFALFMGLAVVTLVIGEATKFVRSGGAGRLWRALRVPVQTRRVQLRKFIIPARRTGRWRALLVRMNETTTMKCGWAMTALVVFALVPYALFVKFVALRGVADLSETVPGDYYFIRDASVSLLHILSWDLAGIMDKINFGDYLAKIPRVSNIVYTALILVPIAVPGVRRSLLKCRPQRQLFGVIYVNVAFAVWATVGYGDPTWFPTFHRSIAALTRSIAEIDPAIGDAALSLASTIVQVLRFPHRFQLILFMLAPLLLALPIAWALSVLARRVEARAIQLNASPGQHRGVQWRYRRPGTGSAVVPVALTIALSLGFFTPLLSNENYRSAYGSGDFSGFLSAYPVEDLSDLKDELVKLPKGKTVVLPPTETAKLVVGPDGVSHKFIDKFYIYYLDQPSFYYGLTGDKKNKFEFFLLLRALYYKQDWWVNIARDMGLQYIVLNKQVENNRGVGAEYLPDIETYLREGIEAVPEQVQQLYENDSFVLYRLDEPAPADRPVLLFDTSWKGFLDTVFSRLNLSRCYDFRYISDFAGTEAGEPVDLITDDVEEAALDIWSIDNPGSFFVPTPTGSAFNSDVITSSYYLSPMFRLYLFFSDTKYNRTQTITPGIFGTLKGSFTGLPRATEVKIPVNIPETGRYRVLMRAAATANDVAMSSKSLGLASTVELRSPPDALQYFGKSAVYDPNRRPTMVPDLSVQQLEKLIPDQLVPVNLRFVYHDFGVIDAEAGSHTIAIDKLDANPILLEGLLLIPESNYQNIDLPPSVRVVEDVNDLGCSERSMVRSGISEGADAVSGEVNQSLTQEQLLALLGGLDDLRTAEPDGIGGRWLHLAATILLLFAGLAVIRRRVRRDPDSDQ
ncbi:MAG: FUSC family protein, partial [Actinomycetia bacterium]|nr:FUSC family protein [Actinomycetes bacterium]